ncbi:nickel/cobalt efflux protein RcnA [mine drainage metagenome]|uniref:Nickel/cobalt efflux protein RcnA n=1 Tax=mine drainage metagenome TaxID=410659 RepID=A0A1J5SL24_9ZZZZ
MLSRLLRLLLPVLVLMPLLLAAHPAAATDLFGKPDLPAAAGEAAPQQPDGIMPPLPAPLRTALSTLVDLQSRLNRQLRHQLHAARDQGGLTPALAIITISFLYGVFHAVGPGHGKMVVGSYFLTRRARLAHGLAMSGAAAFVQAVTAIVLVGVIALLLRAGSHLIMTQAAHLEMLSYAGICALGLWMGWGVLSNRVCCEHHGQPDHDHHHGPEHGHTCGCGHHDHDHHKHAPGPARPAQAAAAPTLRSEIAQVLLTGGAVGLRPCSGAILVLLFTLANGIFWVGVVSTFAMGVGVAITVSVVSLGMLGLNRGLGRLSQRQQTLAHWLRKGLALSGALLILLVGGVQLYGLWTGLIPAVAG